MIPGIYNLNTVGTSPLKRGARQIIDNGGYLTSRQPSALGQLDLGIDVSKSMKVLPTIKNEDLAKKKEVGDPDKYNPITNPIPWYGQNPYINKERKQQNHYN